MGKRELLIAAAFVVLGIAVYRFTAPPGDPSASGFSLAGTIERVRREIHGRTAFAETTVRKTVAVPAAVNEIRIDFAPGPITIVGEDRADVEAEMHVRSNGYDSAEAERLANGALLKADAAGAVLIIAVTLPREGRQTPTVRLKIPARLAVRMDDKGSAVEVTNIRALTMAGNRGKTTVRQIAEAVTLTQRGNLVEISDVGSVNLTTLGGAKARVTRVRGNSSFSLQGGDLRTEELAGTLEVEARGAEMTFDKLDELDGPVRINASLGEVVLIGLRAEARIDGRRTKIRVDEAGGAPLGIYNEGDDIIEVTLPAQGFTMDALAVDGRISLDAKLEGSGLVVDTTTNGADTQATRPETRVAGAVNGGGPAITLRATRGDIILRAR